MNSKFKLNIFFVSVVMLLTAACDRQTNLNEAGDSVPPGVPQGLIADISSDGLNRLRWYQNVEPDFARYYLYKSVYRDSGFSVIYSGTNTYYYDDTLSYDTTYYYKLSAEDVYGNVSKTSTELAAKPENKLPPYPPYNYFGYGRNWDDDFFIYLGWDTYYVTDVKEYKIYRSDEDGFTADSSTYLASTQRYFYEDTSISEFYKTYYYRISVLDKGGLESEPSDIIEDKILPVPELIFPADSSTTQFFSHFRIKTIGEPAYYEIIVSENQFDEPVWQTTVYSTGTNEEIDILFDAFFISANIRYYWRVLTYTRSGGEPNSISDLNQFTITY